MSGISEVNEIFLKGHRIVFPPLLCKHIQQRIHEGQLGLSKHKGRVWFLVFWPGLNNYNAAIEMPCSVWRHFSYRQTTQHSFPEKCSRRTFLLCGVWRIPEFSRSRASLHHFGPRDHWRTRKNLSQARHPKRSNHREWATICKQHVSKILNVLRLHSHHVNVRFPAQIAFCDDACW